MKRRFCLPIAFSFALCVACAFAQSPAAGPNVNMVSGTDWTTGDPFLQRQNEPSLAVSTRNPSHLLAGANDYRSVDFEELFGDVNQEQTADSWLGVFKSFDGGATWRSTLLPGFPADRSASGQSSPLFGLQAAADPIVRAGSNGMFFYAGIAFNRTNNLGKVFVARFIDNNNKENGDPTSLQTPGLLTAVAPTDPLRYLGTTAVQSGTATQFLDKPWLAVDVPRGSATCTIGFTNPDGTTGSQTIPASNVYLTFSDFVNNNTQSMILFTRSTDCGATWSTPIALSGLAVNQGSTIAVAPPIPGTESLPPLVYVAWRRFGSGNTPGAIMMAESFNGGASFTPPFPAHIFPLACNTNPTGAACPFDQGITGTSFRTNAYPALAADTTGRMYLAWSQRQANGDARIVMQVGLVGIPFPPPAPVDNGAVLDDLGNPFINLSGRGHQVMPSLTFNAGKLMLIYYDLRQDHTIGEFIELPDKSYTESRVFEGELVGDPSASPVFNPWIDDAGFLPTSPLTIRRHTMDVQGAQASPKLPFDLTVPTFTSFRVAHYLFGINPFDNPYVAEQFDANPPNLPMFQQGHAPFMGDYIDVAGAPPFVFKNKRWHFNTDSSSGPPVFHATWADNRNVRPPLPNAQGVQDWTQYTPPYSNSNPGGGTVSKFDPSKTTLTCNPFFVASRNQDVYTARIAPGLVVVVLGNQKPLGLIPGTSTLLQRAFSVLVQNTAKSTKTFRLTIANQPRLANGSVDPLGSATFQQVPATPPVTTLDVQIYALSSAAREVFVESQNPTASVQVNVQEISAPGGTVVSGGLTGLAIINPDPTTPPLINPDGTVSNPSVGTAEVYNPAIGNPAIGNPAIGNPAIGNPAIGNPAIGNPAIGNPAIGNQAYATALNPAIGNPAIGNPAIGNPAIGNPAIGNQSVTDASYNLTNTGNTTATYSVKLFASGTLPANLQFQLILNKLYYLNEPGGVDGCTLQMMPTNVILSNVPNPPIVTDPSTLGNPAIGNPAIGNATVAVPPNDTVQVTLRVSPGLDANGNPLPPLTPQQMQSLVLNQLTPVAVSQAINTTDLANGITQPPISLTILTKSLANGFTNQPYSQQLMAIGGVLPPETTYHWSELAVEVSNLPPGLSLSPSGVISGTPTAGGQYNFTVQVADAANPPHTAIQALSLFVIAPLVFTPPATLNVAPNQSFSEDLSKFTSGGLPPYSYAVTSGALPAGFTLSGSVISGMSSTPVSSTFTLQVTDAQSNTATVTQQQTILVVNPVMINSITPSTAAAGFGQTVTIMTTGVPDPTQATVTFIQGEFSAPGFVFPSPSSANTLYVRLPAGMATGPAVVVVTNTATNLSSAPVGITVSSTPGTPVANAIYALATPPSTAQPCGTGLGTSPITSASGGQGIAVSAYGIDSTNSIVRFRQGTLVLYAYPGCAISNSTIGIAAPVVVPSGLTPTQPIFVSIQTTVSDFTSAWSNEISLAATVTLGFVNQPPPTVAHMLTMTPVSVMATDTTGATVSGIPITLDSDANVLTLCGTRTALTNSQGIATFSDLTMVRTGTFHLLPYSGALGPQSAQFDVSDLPPGNILVQTQTVTEDNPCWNPYLPVAGVSAQFSATNPRAGTGSLELAKGVGQNSAMIFETRTPGLGTFGTLQDLHLDYFIDPASSQAWPPEVALRIYDYGNPQSFFISFNGCTPAGCPSYPTGSWQTLSNLVGQLTIQGADGNPPPYTDVSQIPLDAPITGLHIRSNYASGGAWHGWVDNVVLGFTNRTAVQFNFEQPPAPVAPSNGLISYWSLDETSGPALDPISGNNGTLGSNATRVAGLIGTGAVAFDNTSAAYIDVGSGVNNNFSFTTGVTIAAAIRPTWSGALSDYDEIFRKEDGDNRVLLSFQNDNGVCCGANAGHGQLLSFGLNVNGAYDELDGLLDGLNGHPTLASLEDGRTHYVAAVYDSTSGVKAIYIDGALTYQASYPPNSLIQSGGQAHATIGNYGPNGAEPFSGIIDEVRIYDRALTASELKQLTLPAP